jgi:hypothetical protein
MKYISIQYIKEAKGQVNEGNSQEQVEYAEYLRQIKPYCQAWHNQYLNKYTK